MSEYRISADAAGQRLDKYVRRLLPALPLSAIYKLIRTKKVRVNGVRAEEAQLLAAGDVVVIRDQAVRERPGDGAKAAARPAKRTFAILHEDAHILVCAKPAGLAAHPGTGITGATLVDEVRGYLGEPAQGEFKPAPAHRLDRETSGVVIVAKTRQAIVALAETFTNQHPKKVYLALVMGRVEREGVIDTPLAEHQQTPASKAQRGVNLQEAVTRYRLIAQNRDASLVEVEIETGRTHQIRRHFEAIGHPVVGDAKYGDFPFNRRAKAEWGQKRMFLHAARLGLPHPVTGQAMTFRAPLPPELCEVVDRLGFVLPSKFPRAEAAGA
jgi:23S rRNA pseudouridine955/2504/2580 synthase